MTVGGRPFEFVRADVEVAMRTEYAEPFRKHVVEMNNSVYPPKQVVATVTGWDRSSFTSQEAIRVLSRLGFVCRTAREADERRISWVRDVGEGIASVSFEGRLSQMEAAVGTMQEAIASLRDRVAILEAR